MWLLLTLRLLCAPASAPAALLEDGPKLATMAEGDARFEAQDLSGARRAYEAALAYAPSSPALLYRLAVIELLQRRPRMAWRHASAAARLDPGNPSALSLAAAALSEIQASASPAQIQRALEEGRVASAAWLAQVADTAEATAEATGATSDATTDAEALKARRRVEGRARLRLGQGEAAAVALRAGHHDALTLVDLAEAAALSGDLPRARRLAALARAALPSAHPSQDRLRVILHDPARP
ncbi:hypothetical protein KKB55_12520 [Myxococcota bacterium]|nr:hypothetical protein [Myxococcota bacterium]